jgi:three-Cys-motif partner protein
MSETVLFFDSKKPWSKYKDLILDYYLKPYLAKVACLRHPIAVVDCFAGAGRFNDGERGSPLIIADHLARVQERGINVQGVFIEKDAELFTRLKANLANLSVSTTLLNGSFRDFVGCFADLAKTHTIFVYVDPIRPTDLLFDDLACVYEKVRVGRSVETLINLLSTSFMRAVTGSVARVVADGAIRDSHPEVVNFDRIAGGDYWQQVALRPEMSGAEAANFLATGYATQLGNWFDWIIKYPVREKPDYVLPKYHLIFGSRHPDAIELMNDAMVKAKREFINEHRVRGLLFDNRKESEVFYDNDVRRCVVEAARGVGEVTWKELRVRAIMVYPCTYTNPELNRAVKAAIQRGDLGSTSPGTRIDDGARVWFKQYPG